MTNKNKMELYDLGVVIPLAKEWIERSGIKRFDFFLESLSEKEKRDILNRMIGVKTDEEGACSMYDSYMSLQIRKKLTNEAADILCDFPDSYNQLILNGFKHEFSTGFNQELKELESLATEDDETCSEYVRTEGHHSLLTRFIYLFLSQFAIELDINPFIYTHVSINGHHSNRVSNTRALTNALFQSRVHYMMDGKYLPVVVYCGMNGCNHATACVYLPYENKDSEVCVWNRIFIDSSGVSFNECIKDYSEFSFIETTSFFNYQSVLEHTQLKNDVELHEIFFMKNIQKRYGTCSNWSLILSILLVSNYTYLQDKLQRSPTFLTQWANHISSHSAKHMDRVIDMFVNMRRLFYSHFLSAAKRLQHSGIPDHNILLAKYISDILFMGDNVSEPEKEYFLRRVKNLIVGVTSTTEQLFEFKKSQKRQELPKKTVKRSASRSTPSASKRHRQNE